MRIATWNVNSVNARLDRLVSWLETASPDVVCLQELKCSTEDFPYERLTAAGYEVAAHGTGRWNGVAVVSRVGLDAVTRGLVDEPHYDNAAEPRAIGVTCRGVDRKSTRLNSSHVSISYAVFCLKKKKRTLRHKDCVPRMK